MYYIFTTKKDAEAYDQAVTDVANYPKGDNWANPRKHPENDEWAILFNSKVVVEGKEAVELTEDWTPPVDNI